MDEIARMKKQLTSKRKPARPLRTKDLLSTGSTLLNIACSGRWQGAVPKGKYVFFVGDSGSGKTWFSLSVMAEASINPEFDEYDLIYDNVEDGALMDMPGYFGNAMANRLRPPAFDGTIPVYSETIEDFYFHVDDAVARGKPFIYILDSMDALTSLAEENLFQTNKKIARKVRKKTEDEEGGEEKQKGSYGDGKAKKNSSNIRRLLRHLKRTKSILIILNQTRDNIGAGPFSFEKKTRSGGHALKFYATLEIWTSVVEHIRKVVRGTKRELGIVAKAKLKKNRITGRERSIEVPIYHSFGIDDIGSCVDYLVTEKHWPASKGNINAEDFEFAGKREQLIHHIEEESLERQLRQLVMEVWNEVEEACKLKRKPRYAQEAVETEEEE